MVRLRRTPAHVPAARRKTDDLSGTYPAYTEDITVAGSLLKDRLSLIVDTITGRDEERKFELAHCLNVDKVQLVNRFGAEPNIVGTVHVTTTHLIFRADDGSKEIWIANGLIENRNELLAFENRDLIEDLPGWSRLDWDIEFGRQGVSDAWGCNKINLGYQNCDTYPERLWLPTSASANVVVGSTKFRSRGRLPALTYFYRPTGAVICRCAQPLTGFSARNVEDEKLMELIGKASSTGEVLYMIDTRPKINQMVNKAQGKGYEDERNYTNMRLVTFDIDNIHVMRQSQQKLLEAVTKTTSITDYIKTLDSSGWLKHVRSIIECGIFIADALIKGMSCVVHCSDGWDRTSQVVAVAQLILDPFYRTIHGFQVLVEKDWLAFGHKFDDRCAHLGAQNDEALKEISPVFTQFLDCVWQLMQQRPMDFQFNERCLIEMHEHAYSCQFGTFIGNCEKDRKDLNLSKRTKSLWTYFNSKQDDYLNPFYKPNRVSCLVNLDTRAAAFSVWHSLYNRFDDGLLPKENLSETTMSAIAHRIAELKGLCGRGSSVSTSMVDSGHDSSGTNSEAAGDLEDGKLTNRLLSQESGVYEQTHQSSGVLKEDEDLIRFNVRWQPLRNARRCASQQCLAEFPSAVDRRIHCFTCGRIYCRRCIKMCDVRRELVCVGCKRETA
ncbi:hypothetical protein WR25_11658 [Diploscapter pachys]|uniref:Myotubularin phosphatase domain-containing protein n=1 Tax=Diploscapter pachys TaxID=2018661 RepID=A0A2A2KTP0_9BILA|nr:hypothetical protein WR25_11658 [Diploscapter pachys]